jgi:hypothetical protein
LRLKHLNKSAGTGLHRGGTSGRAWGYFREVERELLRLLITIAAVMCSWLWCAGGARADVGIVLNESLDTSVARITGSGHSAVYLSRICPASPVKLRLCGPHEQGSVMSNYTTLGEDEPFEWNIVPLSVFIYGVAVPQNRPLFTSWNIKGALEQNYRESVLRDYCEGTKCRTSHDAEWREMVGATSERTLYILVVSTTIEQDKVLIEKFNNALNVNHFNGFRRNCADFTKDVINTYFPHAAHRNAINDFGMSSPKGVARSFARYAHDQPEAEYHVMHFAQIPGTTKRSTECREGTEQLYHSKKLLLPMAFFAWHELPIAVGSYALTGRFNPEHEFEQHATVREVELDHEITVAKEDENIGGAQLATLEAARKSERARVVGNEQQWNDYRTQFDSILAGAVEDHTIASRDALARFAKELGEMGTASIDNNGAPWVELDQDRKTARVGISPANLLAPGSDRTLAYKLMLAHVAETLKSPPRQRETMPEFVEAWNLMQEARPVDRNSLAMRQ